MGIRITHVCDKLFQRRELLFHVVECAENRMRRRIFGPMREAITGAGEHCVTNSSIIHSLHQILLGKEG
jgi:hypothetical protein